MPTATDRLSGARIFISYSHQDHDAAREISSWVKSQGGFAIWDEQLTGGVEFREKLMSFMECADVFLTLLTESSATRPWVQQEIGYAKALGIPIVPVSSGPRPEGLISNLHAARVHADWSNLREQLEGIDWESHRTPTVAERTTTRATMTRSEIERVRCLVDFAGKAESMGGYCFLRQRAALSSLAIPDISTSDERWKIYDGGTPRAEIHHEWLRQERKAFEKNARREGCRLVLNPHIPFPKEAKALRLRTLHTFLTDDLVTKNVEVALDNGESEGNLTIWGDWWALQSLRPRLGGFREGTFVWHPASVRRYIQGFDEHFQFLCDKKRIRPDESRAAAAEEIGKIIEQLAS